VTPLTMPKLSDSMEEATIVRWLKSEGESFTRGEPLAEIETDKATIVYEAEGDGVIQRFVVREGGTARVGDAIADLGGQPELVQVESGRPRATPVARRRAVELGVSLHGLSGTGPGGRITASDVERGAIPAPAEPPRLVAVGGKGAVQIVELTPTQATIAKRMALSASTIPAFTVTVEIDVSTLLRLREGAAELVEPVPTVTDFLVRACALTLRRFPGFNASFVDGRIERYSRVNIGIAVAVEGALLVPVLADADRKSLAEIARETRPLIERTRSRTVGPEELTNGTFTISNLSRWGVHSFTAIIDPLQGAILAVGGIGRHETLFATLTADHRLVYGVDAAEFLDHLKRLLEHPLALLA
jgi:pyruvate dehydrogenase E2 component (dihydrolipoamide acetyltransferase)